MVKEKYFIEIKEIIAKVLQEMGLSNPEIISEIPPNPEMGDIAFPMFKFSKELKMAPPQISGIIKEKLSSMRIIERAEVKGPYLNLFLNRKIISKEILVTALQQNVTIGTQPDKNESVLIEFSCPNTNKPLHLGHCRNNALGDSMARIYTKAGYKVNKVNLINDRGIHICKSMLAYKLFGNGVTPESAGKKSDHLVGEYYVKYAIESEKNPELEKAAQEMLVKWEQKDPETIELWTTMNKWAVDGIKKTYNRMGISFDNYQYESETYLYGKDIIAEGLKKSVFYKEADGGVWINNEDVGLDKKIVLRSDGTSIYITQDIGTAAKRSELFGFDKMIYVVGSEQIYHFQTLFAIFKKLGFTWADNCYHLSYGMVNLPEGKMKSREGKVIDADNLMELLHEMSYQVINEKHPEWSVDDMKSTAEKISLGALKYYLLNFTTSKDVMFIPEKSISFDGNTGPYLQYVTARINSLLIKAGDFKTTTAFDEYEYCETEWSVISKIADFDSVINKAALEYSPLEICSYLYELSKLYNKMYHDLQILNADTEAAKTVRLMITQSVHFVLKSGLNLLGIDSLEKM
ncbi:MAG: arginine--tRNA ligase [Spirochaetes bacterium GWF1_31_7]|nr:MAG: arginine--tRNA ligase [Spirochaetes bacterium GWE1_32_154]OHD48634.1 MAG: arginine--tRNA ligase [Spirochaetes bacterium GWE2_31_10]OHD49626.1 MAG: arginine--tRNA ligase [Spirochaetes bacterium GWF1_31_7]